MKIPTPLERLSTLHAEVEKAIHTASFSKNPAARCRARRWLDFLAPELAEALADVVGEPDAERPIPESDDAA